MRPERKHTVLCTPYEKWNFAAAEETLVFNFLCSSRLAGADYLSWHPVEEVMGFARTLSDRVRKLEDYLVGDCMVATGK